MFRVGYSQILTFHLTNSIKRTRSSAWIEHLPPKQGVAGSNPAGSEHKLSLESCFKLKIKIIQIE